MEFLLKFMSPTFFYFAFKSFACACSHEGLPKNKIECSKYVNHPDKLELRSRELGQTLNSSLLLIYNRLMECKF